ncbi:MAG: hypothetical protein ACKVZ0_12215 [Gemmatimonadales bacterium]
MRKTFILATLATAGCSGSTTEPPPPPIVGGVPTTAPELFRWLEAGQYRGFARESAAHPSAGPHPVNVIAYLNGTLHQSLEAGTPRHPIGAAAVKELFSTAGALRGWAVMVKIRDDRQDGSAWYWYEVLSRDPSRENNPDFAGVGLTLCSGCHASGRDFIRIPFPLR